MGPRLHLSKSGKGEFDIEPVRALGDPHGTSMRILSAFLLTGAWVSSSFLTFAKRVGWKGGGKHGRWTSTFVPTREIMLSHGSSGTHPFTSVHHPSVSSNINSSSCPKTWAKWNFPFSLILYICWSLLRRWSLALNVLGRRSRTQDFFILDVFNMWRNVCWEMEQEMDPFRSVRLRAVSDLPGKGSQRIQTGLGDHKSHPFLGILAGGEQWIGP